MSKFVRYHSEVINYTFYKGIAHDDSVVQFYRRYLPTLVSNYDGLQRKKYVKESKVTNVSRYVYIFISVCSVVQYKTEDTYMQHCVL